MKSMSLVVLLIASVPLVVACSSAPIEESAEEPTSAVEEALCNTPEGCPNVCKVPKGGLKSWESNPGATHYQFEHGLALLQCRFNSVYVAFAAGETASATLYWMGTICPDNASVRA